MVILATALAPLIWGSTYLVTTEFLPLGRPFTAALLRVLPAGLLLLAWTREWPRWRDMGWLLVLSILNIAFFQAMLFVSAYRLPGGLAAILNSTQTLMVLVLTWWVGRKQPPIMAWASAALGVLGIVLLVYSPQAHFDTLGIIAALAGSASMATGIYFSARFQHGLSVLAYTGWQLLLGGLCLLPVVLVLEPWPDHFTAANVGGYLYLCLVGAVLAYVLYFRGISRLPPAIVSSLGPQPCVRLRAGLGVPERAAGRPGTGRLRAGAAVHHRRAAGDDAQDRKASPTSRSQGFINLMFGWAAFPARRHSCRP